MAGARDGARHFKFITTACALIVDCAPFGALAFAVSAEAGIEFKSFQTHSHVRVAVDPEVVYSVEPIQADGKITGLKLVLNNVHDELEDLSAASDPRTEKVMVVRSRAAGGNRVVYQFLLTEKARAAGIEFFAYRNKSPAEISLDYWLRPSAKVAQPASPAPAKPDKKAVTAKSAQHGKLVVKRPTLPAFGGCGQPLDFVADGVAHWRVYHRHYNYRAFFNMQSADEHYRYPLAKPKPGEDVGERAKELAHYRLALKLYKEAKYALTLRTIEFFHAQYPKSPLKGELRFLKAGTFIQLWKLLKAERYRDQALDIYKAIVLEEGETRRGRNALAFVVQELMDRETPIFALEYALMGASHAPELYEDGLAPGVYRLASAEALYALGEHDRAERAYQLIIDKGGKLAPEAAFRIGEVMSARKYWERAIIYYEKAIRQFPDDAGRFPTAFFNLAEAYFRVARHADAERVYREFERRFENDDALWAARLRIAELEQSKLKTVDPSKHEIIAALYENVVNRHPYSPGAMMAELRMARCFKGLGAEDRTRAFFDNFFGLRELKRFENALVDAPETEQWMDLAEAAFFANNGEPRLALKRADEYRLKIGKVALGESFRKVYAQAVVELATKLTSSPRELLAVVAHYGDMAPKPAPVHYDLAIAKATLALGDMAATVEKLVLLEARLPEATDDEKDWYRLLRARSRRMLGEKPESVMAELAHMRDTGELAVEKYLELAHSSQTKGDLKGALAYDARILDGPLGSKLSIERRLEIHVRKAEAFARLNDYGLAVREADHAILKYGTHTELSHLLNRLAEVRAVALYDTNDYKRAVAAFDEILSLNANHPRRAEFEFMRGKGLVQLGRENEAFETFKKLASAPADDVWRKSAQAELDQLQWENRTLNQIKDRRSSQ